MAIISMLAGLLLPVLNSAIKTAHEIRCMNNQKQIYMGVMLYSDENKGHIPCNEVNNEENSPIPPFGSFVPYHITLAYSGYIESTGTNCYIAPMTELDVEGEGLPIRGSIWHCAQETRNRPGDPSSLVYRGWRGTQIGLTDSLAGARILKIKHPTETFMLGDSGGMLINGYRVGRMGSYYGRHPHGQLAGWVNIRFAGNASWDSILFTDLVNAFGVRQKWWEGLDGNDP